MQHDFAKKVEQPFNEMIKIVLTDEAPLWKILPSAAFYWQAIEIRTRYQYNFYDALIIAVALEASCKTLYSEDLQHGQQIDQRTIKNPFLE